MEDSGPDNYFILESNTCTNDYEKEEKDWDTEDTITYRGWLLYRYLRLRSKSETQSEVVSDILDLKSFKS